ncbi:serine/threonine protein kinase [Radiobacillus sp. PE A8.2]|uniref:serine/threonine protein kinase n=1 Tax=Radiobacillus sp. PE A8.2 TaxID=3380349 RepID=UPI00388DC9AD
MTDRHYKKDTIIYERYKVKSILGVGSYGITYLCTNLVSDALCVVKQMTKSKKRQEISQIYKQEIKILNMLNHPNIPAYIESFTYNEDCFFSMEYIKGRNFEDVLFYDKQTYKEIEALLLIRQLLEVIEYVHAQGVIHGDLRIPNVIVNKEKPYIIDFGLGTDASQHKNKADLFRQDYYDLGDLLLFLLYSGYNAGVKKGRPWTEELSLHATTRRLLKRMLGIDQPYSNTKEIKSDLDMAIDQLS